MSSAFGRDRPQLGADVSLPLSRLLLAMLASGRLLVLSVTDPELMISTSVLVILFALYGGVVAGWLTSRGPAKLAVHNSAWLAGDVVLLTMLVVVTGGPYSALPLLYCIPLALAAFHAGPSHALSLSVLAASALAAGHLFLAAGWVKTLGEETLPYGAGRPWLITALQMLLVIGAGAIASDLADRQNRRRRLHERTARQAQRTRTEVRNIVDHLSSGLITVDRLGKVTRINPAAYQILGIGEEELVGQPATSILAGGGSELAACVCGVAGGGKQVRRAEIEVQSGGRVVPLGITVNPLQDTDGSVVGAVAIFSDLTEVRRMQKHFRRAERLAGVGELAASIAHEIRNPLGSIRGSVEMLAGELDLADQQAQLLDLILKESARVNTIINDFLAFARLRPTHTEPVACRGLMADVVLQIQQHVAVHDGNVNVVHSLIPDDLVLPLDREQMMQLFLNLTINACEAMHYDGELEISVEALPSEASCRIKIADTGPGLGGDLGEEIFTPFFTTKREGTGLGLAMVARIVDAHGGTIEAKNGPGGGAVFNLALPIQPQGPEATADRPGDLVGVDTT